MFTRHPVVIERASATRGPYGHGWGFAWPADRRILYNRASARPDGSPWSDRKKLIWWDAGAQQWTGLDTPDFARHKSPDYRPPAHATGDEALAGTAPFIMHADGAGWIWVAKGLKDGPLPAHYEPFESPIANPEFLPIVIMAVSADVASLFIKDASTFISGIGSFSPRKARNGFFDGG